MNYSEARKQGTQGEWFARDGNLGDADGKLVEIFPEGGDENGRDFIADVRDKHGIQAMKANAALIVHEHNVFPKLVEAVQQALGICHCEEASCDFCKGLASVLAEAEEVPGL